MNCGCPARKVVHGGGGSNRALIPQLKKILTEVKRAITIPMTVKIRAGWDDKSINCTEVAKPLEDCGGSMVTLHGRTRVQACQGFADWEPCRSNQKERLDPVSGSGDILKPKRRLRRFDETGCDVVHMAAAPSPTHTSSVRPGRR
ncbi:MAG: tRNA-dihydrouridine synthase [Acidobacteria bacterium]|nr:tRNA-dihydrouridine synthase [Acidobacteriota bacterium]